jgi:hypothetical protein
LGVVSSQRTKPSRPHLTQHLYTGMLKDASPRPELTCNLLYPAHSDQALSVNPVSGVEKKVLELSPRDAINPVDYLLCSLQSCVVYNGKTHFLFRRRRGALSIATMYIKLA